MSGSSSQGAEIKLCMEKIRAFPFIYLEDADERVESCILDMEEKGELMTEAASGEDSPGSQVDSRLSLLPIWRSKYIKCLMFSC